MYYEYYGLKQAPFKITPDTSMFFPGGDRGAILDALIYAIVSGEGIVKLVGEVGSGKTTLCRMLEKELPKNVEIVYLANPSLSPDNILHAIAFELHLKVRPDDSRLKVMNSLQNYLLERHAENKQVVVFVEEAQSMPIATLEEIRLLSNLETAQNKLLQIVIFGQPELDTMISKQEIRQLKERITYSFYLSPLKPDEVRDYINSRLRACGYRSVELFNDKAIKVISKYSNGLLRRINILADKAMLASYAANVSVVTAKHVKLAAQETEFITRSKLPVLRWGLIVLSIFIISITSISLNKINWSTDPIFEVILSEKNNEIDLSVASEVEDIGSSSLMLVEEVREKDKQITGSSEGVTNNKVASSEVGPADMTNSESSNDVLEVLVAKPDPSTLEVSQWQQLDDNVLLYAEAADDSNVIIVEEKTNETDLLEIRDLIRAVGEHSDDELALLKQLTILPSEAAINHKSVANGLTCRLCSTIIYRPLKDDKKL